MQVEPYLFFEGRCDEAIEFYRQALGAEVKFLMRFKDAPDETMRMPGQEEMIMHANLRIGDTTIMASDGRCHGAPDFKGFALSIAVANEAEAERFFGALSIGGNVMMPLTKTFYSPSFGMVTDRFGVLWMINVVA